MEATLAQQGYRRVERLGRRYLILASPEEQNYMLFVETHDAKRTRVTINGQGYQFVRPIVPEITPDLYQMAIDADSE